MAAVALRKTLCAAMPVWMETRGVNTLGQNGIAKSATFPSALWLLCIYFVTVSFGYCGDWQAWDTKLASVCRRLSLNCFPRPVNALN